MAITIQDIIGAAPWRDRRTATEPAPTMSEKRYTPADIIKALPTLATLYHKPFKELKEMYRAGGGPNKGRHVSKRDCIVFIAFGNQVAADAVAQPDYPAMLREVDLQLKAANAAATSARRDADAQEKRYRTTDRERDNERIKNDQLLGTLRQLMSL